MLDVNKIVNDQLQRYPLSQTQDLIKALYQAEFGCGHLIQNSDEGLEWMKREALSKDSASAPEDLGNGFCRYHLSRSDLEHIDTLYRLFVATGSKQYGAVDEFKAALAELKSMIESRQLRLDADAVEFIDKYISNYCPALHHSDTFRTAYAPAYRVMRSEYMAYLPLFYDIDALLNQKERVLVAIDGRSASGKTTLAALLKTVYDCNVFHMDDFYLRPEQRTPERYAEPGGNVDRERFVAEVLTPLRDGLAFSYRVFDCQTMALGAQVDVQPKRLNIIEGAYSMHPDLRSAYDYSCFYTIDPELQSQRILHRNGPERHTRFINEWIPYEEKYIAAFDVQQACTRMLKASNMPEPNSADS